MGIISRQIYNVCMDVSNLNNPYRIKVQNLIREFGVEERTSEIIDFISGWLNDRDVECIPPIDSVPLDTEVVLMSKKGHGEVHQEAKSKLQVRLLKLGNLKEDQIPFCRNDDSVETALLKHYETKLENLLVMEEYIFQTEVNKIKKLRPIGFININSFSAFFISKGGNFEEKIDNFVNKKFKEVKSSDPLLSTIDEMIKSDINFLLIKNDEGKIAGACDLKELLKEYYPLSKPYLVLSLIENSLLNILKRLNYSEDDYHHIMSTTSNNYKISSITPPKPESLTLYQKSLLLDEKYTRTTECTPTLIKLLESLRPKIEETNPIRNKLAHFKPEVLTQTEYKILENLSDQLTNILNLLPKN